MKKISLLTCLVAAGGLLFAHGAMAKTAKECTAEWRADKAGMQARGTTEKSYVEQCKSDATPNAPPAPAAAAPTPPAQQSAAASSKTAKDCTAEWRADKAGMQARGVTERVYVAQCKNSGVAPSPSAAAPSPTVPPSAPTPVPAASGQRSASECIAEWRADKAGMQSRGVTEKAYVTQCRTGGTPPVATAPTPAPKTTPVPTTTAAPALAPAAPPARTAPPMAEQKPAAPAATPAAPPPSAKGERTLEEGQFASEAPAKARCPADTVVWVNLPSKVYHFAGTRSYGTTKRGAYMCEKEAVAAENRASKSETRPSK